MDASTELTCPECGKPQPHADECLSCGANLFILEEDIPTIQGDKTVSIPWPTQSSTTPTSPESSGDFSQKKSPGEVPFEKSADANSRTMNDSLDTDQATTTLNWSSAELANDQKPGAAALKTQESATDVLPELDLSDSQEAPTTDKGSPVEQTEATIPAQQPDDHPPVPVDQLGETSTASNRVRHPLFWGTGQSLFGIFIVNTFLTLITLGIYSFWGRARVREFLNSQTSFANARFAYHGTGKELFTGWLKAMLVFGIPYLSLSAIPFFVHGIPQYISQGIAGLLLLYFIPVAVVGAHRYRMSRTSLRNIRFSFRGTVKDYTNLWLKGSVLTVLTLGFYYPFFENARRHYLVSHSQFGSRAFEYDGTGKGLLAVYSKAAGLYVVSIILLSSVTFAAITAYLSVPITDTKTILFASSSLPIITIIGLIVSWFYLQAARQRFFWNHTQFGESRFTSTVTAWKIFELRLGHLFLLMSTLGLAWPWVQVRNLQFFYYYTALSGPSNLHQIEQEALDASPTGEELAGFFDTGFDLG